MLTKRAECELGRVEGRVVGARDRLIVEVTLRQEPGSVDPPDGSVAARSSDAQSLRLRTHRLPRAFPLWIVGTTLLLWRRQVTRAATAM
jgi:hypothetical protein